RLAARVCNGNYCGVTRAALNPTRDTIRTALRQAGKNWADALPTLDKWFRGGLSEHGWGFVQRVTADVCDFRPSPRSGLLHGRHSRPLRIPGTRCGASAIWSTPESTPPSRPRC